MAPIQWDDYEGSARCWNINLKGVGTGHRWTSETWTADTEGQDTCHPTWQLTLGSRGRQPKGEVRTELTPTLGHKLIRGH